MTATTIQNSVPDYCKGMPAAMDRHMQPGLTAAGGLSATSPRPRIRAGGELSRSELLAVMRRQAETAKRGDRKPAVRASGSRKQIFANKVFGRSPTSKAD